MAVNNKTLYVCKTDDRQREKLRAYLEARNWKFSAMRYAYFKAVLDKTSIIAYHSGKLTVQGQGTEEFVLFFLEPEILHTSGFGYEAELSGEPQPVFSPHAGVDESGKGDFFGPLTAAGVFVDEESGKLLSQCGVRDSKTIKSDRQIKTVAAGIRQAVKGKFTVVAIGPLAYNRMYASFGNLNKLLAWAHARVIENLLEKVPDCSEVLVDKFAAEYVVKSALREKGRNIRLRQETKAESDIAVAAASILARERFIRMLEQLGEDAGITLPRGAGGKVLEAGIKIAGTRGVDDLGKFAKLHFKTCQEIRNSCPGSR
ncbi:MAG: ribonuclease HIII [Victivallales bacterium]|nr:ribonuclease HIII [Victivallales bacterium]